MVRRRKTVSIFLWYLFSGSAWQQPWRSFPLIHPSVQTLQKGITSFNWKRWLISPGSGKISIWKRGGPALCPRLCFSMAPLKSNASLLWHPGVPCARSRRKKTRLGEASRAKQPRAGLPIYICRKILCQEEGSRCLQQTLTGTWVTSKVTQIIGSSDAGAVT